MNEMQFIIPKEGPLGSKQRFLIMIAGSIVITCIIVTIGMTMYYISGTAQLDLSRPGYKSVRAQSITGDNNLQQFPENGAITQSTIDSFKKIYTDQATKIKAADAFSGDPLSPEALGLDATTDN
jgi:hypothetical protein